MLFHLLPEICDECQYPINCVRQNIYIVNKLEEERVWCNECFDDLWRQAHEDGWGGDDIEYAIENGPDVNTSI